MTTTPTPALPLHIGEIVGRRLISEDASEFWGYFEDGYQGTKKEYVYTAEQMREYGRACIAQASAARVPSDAPDYSDMSREAVERHAARMAQALADDRPQAFYRKYATGPMRAPSCLCCGQLPDEISIQHLELPGIIICKRCRDRALVGSSGGSDSQTLIDAYALGWHACSSWAERDDLLADIGSPAYISEREIMLSGMSTSTAGAEKPKPGIVVRFQPVSAGLPKLAHYSTSYGGQWTSERCVVIDGFGDVGTSRLSVSASVKEAIDAGRNPPIVWRDGVGSPTVAAWAYAIAIKATLASPPLPSPVAEVKPTAPESVDWTPDEAEKVQRFFDGKPQARPPEEKS